MAAFECRYDCPVVWAHTPEAAACLIEDWVFWYARELVLNCNEILRAASKLEQPADHREPEPVGLERN